MGLAEKCELGESPKKAQTGERRLAVGALLHHCDTKVIFVSFRSRPSRVSSGLRYRRFVKVPLRFRT